MNDLFAWPYENLGSFPLDFQLAMFNQSLYQTVGLIIVAMALLGNLFYYYLLDHPRWQRWYHWLIITAVVDFVVTIVVGYVVKNDLDSINLFFSGEYVGFFFFNLFFFLAISFLWTFVVRWGSKSCYKTPIPL
jgi:hypothetical protein